MDMCYSGALVMPSSLVGYIIVKKKYWFLYYDLLAIDRQGWKISGFYIEHDYTDYWSDSYNN